MPATWHNLVSTDSAFSIKACVTPLVRLAQPDNKMAIERDKINQRVFIVEWQACVIMVLLLHLFLIKGGPKFHVQLMLVWCSASRLRMLRAKL